MSVQIRVKNFGPIRAGFDQNNGWLLLPKVTLFCGPQGSGKSSVTKLISLLSWLEKSAYRNPELRIDRDVFERALEWQNVANYLKPDTEIEYRGDLLHFAYINGKISAELFFDDRAPYVVPKISYMPAERNFASIVRAADRVEGLPRPLVDMLVEFGYAKKCYGNGYRLPTNGFSFLFDKDPWIVNGEGEKASRTRLEEASSGLQSLVPLLLVSEFLASHLAKDDGGRSMGLFYDPGTSEKKARIDAFRRELASSTTLTAEQKQQRIDLYFAPSCRFLNIVEEPEQNLFPETQCDVMAKLLAIVNNTIGNKLVVSTHSPYVVNALVAAQMAAEILARTNDDAVVRRVDKIFPALSATSASDMSLYELSSKGEIRLLPKEGGIFSDENLLNSVLGDWNDSFDRLLEIEARLNG